jgi:two-component system nitrate/nitrite response regulator NarL
MAKLAVLDPSGLFRAALVSLLRDLGFEDLTEAADLEELERRVSVDPRPDVVLINLSRGDDAVDQIMRRVRTMLPDSKVVFLARSLDLDLLAAVFAAGASGYLLENTSGDALGKSLTLVNAGGKVFPPELATFIPNLAIRHMAPPHASVMLQDSRLSEREVEILQCLTQGQSNKAIAHALDIAEATVKVHVKRILRKIDVTNRTQAALWAASRGLTGIGTVPHRAPAGAADILPVPVALPAVLHVAPRHVAMRQAVAIKAGGDPIGK